MLLKTLLVFLGASFFNFGLLYAIGNIKVANSVGKELSINLLDTHFEPVKEYAESLSVSEIKKIKPKNVSNDVLEKLTNLFKERLSSAKEIAEYAENIYKNFTPDVDVKLDESYEYFDTNGGGANVKIEERFSDKVKVNLNLSVVQTPTDVYQFAEKILTSIDWTKDIDEKMKENLDKTKTKFKAWQYVGLSDGVFRTYPGSYWSNSSESLQYFDCRQRAWYITGSASPKDMVIIVDLSGSVIGNRLLIIKLAVMSLIDTLQEDDFVNIIYFNEQANYLKTMKNYNWTDLVQATARNKKILKDALQNDLDKGKKTANVASGFTMAFEILKRSRKNIRTTSNCTQTIAFFTDGVEGDSVAEDVFSKYNSKKETRVFTYLVGREKGSPFKAVKWIACENKGYFYRIETLSDVRENIVKYVNVLSRSTNKEPKWTPLYLDAQGLGLLTALVVPIFNTKEDSKDEQLGVIGIDVMLDEILSTIPQYEIGAGGYAFSITNNGLIYFHPLLDKEERVTPNIYLSEVERHFPEEDINELAKKMIDGESGTTNFNLYTVLTRYKNKFRISKRKINYAYGHIVNTSFSAAVAMTDYGSSSIVLTENKDKNVDVDVNGHTYTIAKWPFCNETITEVQLNGILGGESKYCKNKDLINRLKGDFLAIEKWKSQPSEYVTKIFFGTASGLTFVPYILDQQLDFETSIKQEYYERAADHWEEKTVIFSALNKDEVNASKAVVVERDGQKAVWGVVGMQFKPQALQDILKNLNECGDDSDDSVKRCYLVDEHGYIVASSYANQTSEFFGKVEGTVMKDLVHQKGYHKYEFTDVQASCSSGYDEEESSSSVRILDPLYALGNYAKWWTQTIALSLIQYSLYSILTGLNQVKAEDDNESRVNCNKLIGLYFRPDVTKSFTNESLSYDGCHKSYYSHVVNGTNLMLVIVEHTNSTYCASRNEKVKDDPTIDIIREPLFTNKEPSSGMYYRREPVDGVGACYPKAKESSECSSGKVLLPSLVMVIFLQMILNGSFDLLA